MTLPVNGGTQSPGYCEANEPTDREAAALAEYERHRKRRTPVPGFKVTMSKQNGKPHARIEVDHPDALTGYKLLSVALGGVSRDLLTGTVDSLAMAAQPGGEVSQDALNYNLAFARELKPQEIPTGGT